MRIVKKRSALFKNAWFIFLARILFDSLKNRFKNQSVQTLLIDQWKLHFWWSHDLTRCRIKKTFSIEVQIDFEFILFFLSSGHHKCDNEWDKKMQNSINAVTHIKTKGQAAHQLRKYFNKAADQAHCGSCYSFPVTATI